MFKKKLFIVTLGFIAGIMLTSLWATPVHAIGWSDVAGVVADKTADFAVATGSWAKDRWEQDINTGGPKGVTSFVEFQGGLQAPSGAGLAPELTQVKTATDFIKKITNFALGFLGLIAVVIIIYGGFRYVTSAGEEEAATAGKKAIQYALIGILLILASFAAVNTLLKSTTGSDLEPGAATGGRGAAQTSTQTTSGRTFNLAAMEIRASASNFGKIYQNYAVVDTMLNGIKQLPAPTTVEDIRAFTNGAESAMNQIKSLYAITDETYVAANNVIDQFVNEWSKLSDKEIGTMLLLENPNVNHPGGPTSFHFIPSANAAAPIMRIVNPNLQNSPGSVNSNVGRNAPTPNLTHTGSAIIDAGRAVNTSCTSAEATGFYCSGTGKFHASFKDAMDTNFYKANPQPHKKDFDTKVSQIIERLTAVQTGLGTIGNASAGDNAKQSLLSAGITSDEELQQVLNEIPTDWTIAQSFSEGLKALGAAKDAILKNAKDVTSAQKAIKQLGILFAVVRDIKFMSVKINASAYEGNAPLSVQFTSVGSLDPSGQTIADSQHQWDLDGDGASTELDSLGCKERGIAVVTCSYPKAGTYRVSLRLDPKNENTQTASGVAIVTIRVNPPSSRIHLEAEVGGARKTLFGYNADGVLTDNMAGYTVTKEEAKVGILYDASKTTDETGNAGGIKFFDWNFGDGTNNIIGPNAKTIENPRKTYKNTGTFPLTLNVTDKGGKKDRVSVNITVTSIAARIISPNLSGDVNTTFTFDGSRSKSDVGSIESYEWSITDEKGSAVQGLQNNTTNAFRYKFKTSGKYTVKLKVVDKAGNEATDEAVTLVESQKPKADFEIRGCSATNPPCLDAGQPSLVELDASKSFDPDAGDSLSYTWNFPTLDAKNDVEVVTGALKDATADKTKTVRIKFKKTGTFPVRLTVEDQHQDPSLRKKDTVQKDVIIGSVIGLAWDAGMATAQNLKSTNGSAKADVTFSATVNMPTAADGNAITATMDFGDGSLKQELDTQGNESRSFGSFTKKLTVPHPYTKADNFTATLTIKTNLLGETTIQKRIHIGAGDMPIAVIDLKKNDENVFLEENKPIRVLNKVDELTFDAGNSLNTDGTAENLSYSWDFGDSITKTGVVAKHIYTTTSPTDPGYFEVTLNVIEQNPQTGALKTGQAKMRIVAGASKPTLHALSVVKQTDGDATPLNFEITADGADDADGEVKEYTFWYFDESDADRKLSVVTTNANHAILKVETKGLSGEEKKYSFCVEMKDNENNVSTCPELFPDPKNLPFAIVKNGANQSPHIDITVDHTNIKVGDSITFSARATDSDGRVVKYIWDVLGDGFHNDAQTELSQITQKYEQKSPASGYKVRAEAIDDKGATGFSNEIPIFVFPKGNPPIARFQGNPSGGTRISFNNLSTVAPGSDATLSKFFWDFDIDREFSTENGDCPPNVKAQSELLCDHDKTNDPDSTERDPVFEYPASGSYRVRLIVEDSNGIRGETTMPVTVARNATPSNSSFEAVLKSNPMYVLGNITDPATGQPKRVKQIHVATNGAPVTFYIGESRGHIIEYAIDANKFFDTSGDGVRDNDKDFTASDGSKTFRWQYNRAWCAQYNPATKWCTAVLTVTGTNEFNQVMPPSTDEIYIMFEPPVTGGASLFNTFGANEGILLGLASGAILMVVAYFGAHYIRNGKPRIYG